MAKRKPKSVLSKHLPEVLLFAGIALVVVSSVHNFLRLRALRLDKSTVESYISQTVAITPARPIPAHIFIKWYIDVDIDQEVYVEGNWTISETKASYLANSARPGESGNLILYGHNKRSIMGNLRALKGYETITLTLSDGSSRNYQIISRQEVSPTDTKLLEPTDFEVLTLYTCSGFMDSKRFVVRAIPLLDPVVSP